MATDKQIEANRRNAQRSTGPKTQAGKQASCRNALKHGLTSSLAVLPDEDQDEFNQLLARLRISEEPQGELEDQLLIEICDLFWRLRRHSRTEKLIFTWKTSETLDEMNHELNLSTYSRGRAVALFENIDTLNRVNCYESRVRRDYHRALQQLQLLQKNRRRHREAPMPRPEQPVYIEPEVIAAPEETTVAAATSESIGFDSPNSQPSAKSSPVSSKTSAPSTRAESHVEPASLLNFRTPPLATLHTPVKDQVPAT